MNEYKIARYTKGDRSWYVLEVVIRNIFGKITEFVTVSTQFHTLDEAKSFKFAVEEHEKQMKIPVTKEYVE